MGWFWCSKGRFDLDQSMSISIQVARKEESWKRGCPTEFPKMDTHKDTTAPSASSLSSH